MCRAVGDDLMRWRVELRCMHYLIPIWSMSNNGLANQRWSWYQFHVSCQSLLIWAIIYLVRILIMMNPREQSIEMMWWIFLRTCHHTMPRFDSCSELATKEKWPLMYSTLSRPYLSCIFVHATLLGPIGLGRNNVLFMLSLMTICPIGLNIWCMRLDRPR
jgi:hypothetical protein